MSLTSVGTSSSCSTNVNMNKRFKSSNIIDASILQKISNQIIDLQMTFTNRINILENKLDLLVTCYSEIMERLENENNAICNPSNSTADNQTNSIKTSIIKNSLSTTPDGFEKDDKCCKETLNRLANIENMIEKIVSIINTSVELTAQNGKRNDEGSLLTVLLPQMKPKVEAQLGLDSSIQVITLNSESDYPDGSWLGDENNFEARVRVPITPSQLLHINTQCTTPAKMAIVLVDYLFPKEVLATSNLSGKGRHSKKQLDPLMIYGIRSHLQYKFKITEKDWYRIKQNIDSKCRTAWRKKVKGMLLGENKNPMLNSANVKLDNEVNSSSSSCNNFKPFILSTNSLSSEEFAEDSDSGIVRTNRGHFKIVRATAEQVAKLQESHTVKVFTNEDVAEMFPPSQMFSVEDMDSYTLTGCRDEQTLTIVTENGEVSVPISISTEDSLGSDNQFITSNPLVADDDDDEGNGKKY